MRCKIALPRRVLLRCLSVPKRLALRRNLRLALGEVRGCSFVPSKRVLLEELRLGKRPRALRWSSFYRPMVPRVSDAPASGS